MIIFIILLISTYSLLLLFWAVMTLRRMKLNGTLTTTAKILGAPALIVGYILDWFVNQTLGRILFLELKAPLKEIVTARFQRYADGPNSWRRRIAKVIDFALMRPADPAGYHTRWPEEGDGK